MAIIALLGFGLVGYSRVAIGFPRLQYITRSTQEIMNTRCQLLAMIQFKWNSKLLSKTWADVHEVIEMAN